MRRSDDDDWADGEQGDRTEVLSCDPLRSEGADPRVPVSCVPVVRLGFGTSCKVYFIHWGKTRCSLFLLFGALSSPPKE